jgi:hypothetical protein
VASDQPVRRSQHVGEQVAAAAAAAGVPIMAPIAESRIRRALASSGGVRLGGPGAGGGHPSGVGHPSGGSHLSSSLLSGEGQLSGRASTENTTRPTGAAAEVGRGASTRAGDLMAPMGAGRGKNGEDSEHQRPSYLIEMDDIFTDGRKVAPAVIGADPAEQDC